LFFKFLESVERFQPATVKQLCSDMRESLGRVRAAKAFAETYGFIESRGDHDILLSELGTRITRYSGNSRIDFLLSNARLQEKEPFAFLTGELMKQNFLTLERVATLLQLKFEVPSNEYASNYARDYTDWLVELRIARRNKEGLEYTGGRVRSLDVIALPEAKQLLDSSLYDYITEEFNPYQQMLHEPSSLLNGVAKTKDGNQRGRLFEEFVASVFKRLGFSTRLCDGAREKKRNLTFQRPGGGDVGAFCHFPTTARGRVSPGFAIAFETKSTEGAIGSNAIGQVRNLAKKISESFENYVVQSLVISRSKVGYDQSGRDQAPPEVVHLTSHLLLELLNFQLGRVQAAQSLVTPLDIMLTLDDLVRDQNLQPDWKAFSSILLKHL